MYYVAWAERNCCWSNGHSHEESKVGMLVETPFIPLADAGNYYLMLDYNTVRPPISIPFSSFLGETRNIIQLSIWTIWNIRVVPSSRGSSLYAHVVHQYYKFSNLFVFLTFTSSILLQERGKERETTIACTLFPLSFFSPIFLVLSTWYLCVCVCVVFLAQVYV